MALSLDTKTFKYGEHLIKAGQVPPGLFVMLEGQCLVIHENVAAKPLGKRPVYKSANIKGS